MKKLYKCSKCETIIFNRNKSGLCRSCCQLGKKFTKKHKDKISKSAKERFKNKENHPHFGKRNPDANRYKKYYCKICGVEITTGSKSGLCGSCSQNKRYKDPKEREKLSQAHKGRVKTKEELEKLSIATSGKKHWNYVHGQSHFPYSNKFTPALKREIHERDNFICQCCGMTQEEHLEKYNRNIEIHHIDYDKYNCKSENLITLCHQCNINANFNRDYYYAYYTYLMENKYAKIY